MYFFFFYPAFFLEIRHYSAFWVLSTAEDMAALLNTSTLDFTNILTSREEAVGTTQSAKSWQEPVKTQQMAPRGVKPRPQHPTGGGDASPSKATGMSPARSPVDPQQDCWGGHCCRVGLTISNRINLVVSDSFPSRCLLGNIKASGIVGVPKCLNSEN